MDKNTIKIRAIIGAHGRGWLAKKIGISVPTLNKRIENPGQFTVANIEAIEKIYNRL